MKKLFLPTFFLATILALTSSGAGAGEPNLPAAGDFVPGEILVQFQERVLPGPLASGATVTGLPSLDSLVKELGGRGIFSLLPAIYQSDQSDLARTYILRLPPGADVLAAAQLLQSDPNIEYAEPNYIAHITFTPPPNDDYYGDQWNLNNTGQTGGTPDADIDAPEAWNDTQGNARVIIAFLDTGVDLDHPDLAGKIWVNSAEAAGTPAVDDDGNGYVDDVNGWDFVGANWMSPTPDNDPDDDHYHGSHVSGIAAAATDNGEGIAGVCPNCTIMPLKVCDSSGICPESAISAALHYAADNGALIANMSLGGFCSSTMAGAVNHAWGHGVLLIAAAGNGAPYTIDYPARFRRVMAVGATDDTDKRASFSDTGTQLDIVAPGVSILSTIPVGYYPPYLYAFLDGTSMSTPHVSGVAGLVWSKNPALTHRRVWRILIKTADDLGAGGKDIYYGHGRVNAHRAVERALNPPRAIRQRTAHC